MSCNLVCRTKKDFNPRTPRGVRPNGPAATIRAPNFNPRTPRGVRLSLVITLSGIFPFQSTHPARGATPYGLPDPEALRISIHAPREGCDMVPPCLLCLRVYFNPRTPRGVRLLFATLLEGHNAISIHAPREGCDRRTSAPSETSSYFNPRTPRGVRRTKSSEVPNDQNFNPRTPRGVRRKQGALITFARLFQSTHPARGATLAPAFDKYVQGDFNPRTPRGVRQIVQIHMQD